MPYVQRLPDRLLRSEWATRIASELRVDEPVLREALRRAANERRSEVKLKPELLAPVVKPAERRLIQMLVEAEGFREKLAIEIVSSALHRGLETERIIEVLVTRAAERPDAATIAGLLEEADRRLLFEVLFDQTMEHTWEEAEACLEFLRNRQISQELSELERKVQAQPAKEELLRLLARKDELKPEFSPTSSMQVNRPQGRVHLFQLSPDFGDRFPLPESSEVVKGHERAAAHPVDIDVSAEDGRFHVAGFARTIRTLRSSAMLRAHPDTPRARCVRAAPRPKNPAD